MRYIVFLFISIIMVSCVRVPFETKKDAAIDFDTYMDTWINVHISEMDNINMWSYPDKISVNDDGSKTYFYRKSMRDIRYKCGLPESFHIFGSHSLMNIYIRTDSNGWIKSYKYEEATSKSFTKREMLRPPGPKNPKYKIEDLGQAINTEYTEILPVIAPDGKTLFFVRDNSPENFGYSSEAWSCQDIYVSKLLDNVWTKARQLSRPLNNENNNFLMTISPDGNTILLGGDYQATSDGVSIATTNSSGFGTPVKQYIENYYNDAQYNEFYLSNDGSKMLMAIDREDSYYQKDIYISFKIAENHWSMPMNLGDVINTAGNETSPFLAADGITLYYSTDGFETYGSNDIFMSKRLDDTWKNWSKPVNLGPEINTSEWDAYYFLPASGDYAYFSRNEDIYRLKIKAEIKPDPVLLIFGTVKDAKTLKPVSADIVYEYEGSSIQAGTARSNPVTGEYKIVLPIGKDYIVHASASKYYGYNTHIETKSYKKYNELEYNLTLEPIIKNTVFILEDLYFDTGLFTIRPESAGELNKLYKFMTDNPEISIEISGHTDNVGSDKDNLLLSENRAKAVAEYLINRNIPNNRISYKGYGETKPIDSNESEEGRQNNRRVEIKIIKI